MSIEEYAEKVAATWPPLTAAQCALIQALLSEPTLPVRRVS